MFGLMGFDWGYGFDDGYTKNTGGSNFHFIMGQQF
jgi:outer membrane protein insertion porin family